MFTLPIGCQYRRHPMSEWWVGKISFKRRLWLLFHGGIVWVSINEDERVLRFSAEPDGALLQRIEDADPKRHKYDQIPYR